MKYPQVIPLGEPPPVSLSHHLNLYSPRTVLKSYCEISTGWVTHLFLWRSFSDARDVGDGCNSHKIIFIRAGEGEVHVISGIPKCSSNPQCNYKLKSGLLTHPLSNQTLFGTRHRGRVSGWGEDPWHGGRGGGGGE